MSDDPRPIQPRKPPLQHLMAAFGFSMAGGRFLLRQRAAQFQIVMIVVTAGIFALAGAGAADWAVMLALGICSLAVEAVNTALELIVDRVSPEISDFGKHTKDLGSFAVFCALVVFVGHALWVVAVA